MPKHLVTIGLYSVQQGSTFGEAALRQVSNILNIRNKLRAAAEARGSSPPEMVLSVLLIPDWENGSSYTDHEYIQAKNAFLQAMQDALNAEGLGEIHLENFYDVASETEKAYLEGLQAKGSNADMIKTHALIRGDNQDASHLQLDSNTIIHDFQGLYDVTFGGPSLSGFNASYYDDDYVSIHNKIVYVSPNAAFVHELRDVHLTYCDVHKNDHLRAETQKEKLSKNSIYAKDFAVAAHRAGLTTVISIPQSGGDLRTIYSAVMSRPEYGLSQFIVTAVNMSWSASNTQQPKILSTIPPVQIDDAVCDFACFKMAIKKHTGNLKNHKYGEHPKQLIQDMNIEDPDARKAALNEDKIAHEQLLARSNVVVDKAIISKFYDNAVDFFYHSTELEEIMATLAEMFPNDQRGDVLTQEIFGCTVNELYAQPIRHTKHYEQENLHQTSVVVSTEQQVANIQTQQAYREALNHMRLSVKPSMVDNSHEQSLDTSKGFSNGSG